MPVLIDWSHEVLDREKEKRFYLSFMHTYHSRFFIERVAETSQISERSTLSQNGLAMRNTAHVTGGKPIAVGVLMIRGVIFYACGQNPGA
jgi:hypothetical protein